MRNRCETVWRVLRFVIKRARYATSWGNFNLDKTSNHLNWTDPLNFLGIIASWQQSEGSSLQFRYWDICTSNRKVIFLATKLGNEALIGEPCLLPGFIGLLNSAFTGRPTTSASVVVASSSAAFVLVDDSLVLVFLVDNVTFSVGAFVVVELVVWKVVVELVVVDGMVDFKVVVEVVGALVAVVVGFRLHRGS